jgi:glycosyltransferase involved in cell wall biosynthesis
MSSRIKVELVIPTLDAGGAEKQLSLLATALDRERFDVGVTTLTRGGPYEQELKEAGIPITSINKRFKIDPFAWRRLWISLRQRSPDIVHTWIFAANAYGRSAALRAGVPVVLGSERCVDPWKSFYQHWCDRRLVARSSIRQSTSLTTNSVGVVDFYDGHGIPSSQFEVIPNAILPPSPPRRSRQEVFDSLNIPTSKRLILSVGRLWPQKGYKDLVWAAELLRVLRDDICYVIVGDGPQRERLEHFVDQIKAASAIRFAGQRDDVQELMHHAELLLNGSLYEGQSNSILEAMQSGVPVVATDIPGTQDLITHDSTGLLVPIRDPNEICKAANRILIEDGLAERLTKNAREKMQSEFSLEQMVRRHEQLYQRLFNETKGRDPR